MRLPQPSDVVVMENFIRTDTQERYEDIDAKYELSRGQYTMNVNPSEIRPYVLNHKVPLELYEARNAVRIAQWTGADRVRRGYFRKSKSPACRMPKKTYRGSRKENGFPEFP